MKTTTVLVLVLAAALFAQEQAAPAGMVEGTVADRTLQKDITRMIQLFEGVNHPDCKVQIVKRWRSVNTRGLERWEAKSCDTTTPYEVRMVDSPGGGTDFSVGPIVEGQKKETETISAPGAGTEANAAESAPGQQKATATQPPAQQTAAAQPAPAPKVKTGKIKENERYKSRSGMFSVTVPAARNPFVQTYKFDSAQLKHENLDYEEVVFHIDDFGQAYGTGMRRIPQEVMAEMAKQQTKEILSSLSKKALFQWRNNYAEEPQTVDEASAQTQFGEGLLRVYLARNSSLLTNTNGADLAAKRTPEKSDARIAVLVIKKDDWFIYAAEEDEYTGSGAASLDLRKQLETFFSSLTVKFPD